MNVIDIATIAGAAVASAVAALIWVLKSLNDRPSERTSSGMGASAISFLFENLLPRPGFALWAPCGRTMVAARRSPCSCRSNQTDMPADAATHS